MAEGSSWSPEKQLVIFQQTAALRGPASRESYARTGKASESRDGGDVLPMQGGVTVKLCLFITQTGFVRGKANERANPGCPEASEVGLKHCRVKAYEENERSCVQEKCILPSSGCREDLCRA